MKKLETQTVWLCHQNLASSIIIKHTNTVFGYISYFYTYEPSMTPGIIDGFLSFVELWGLWEAHLVGVGRVRVGCIHDVNPTQLVIVGFKGTL